MDEYIPQLTLTPDLNAQPQPEVKQEADLITKAQAAPEAGPDLSALFRARAAGRAGLLEADRSGKRAADPRIRRFRTEEHRRFLRHGVGQGQDRRSGRDRRYALRPARRAQDDGRAGKEGHRRPVPQGKDQRRGDEEPLRDGGGQCRPHLRRAGKAQDHAAEGRSRDGSDVRAEPAVLQGADHVYSGR